MVKKRLDEADLAYVRIELLNNKDRIERELEHVWFVFMIGFGSLVATLVLVNANMIDKALFAGFLAFICLIGSIYVRVLYPRRLANTKEKLEQLDEVLKLSQALPTNIKRNMGRSFLQTHEDLKSDFMRLNNRISLLESYRIGVGVFAVGLATLVSEFIGGYHFESILISGSITVMGIVMVLLKYRKRHRALPRMH